MALTPKSRMARWEKALIKTLQCANDVKIEKGLTGIEAMQEFWKCREKKIPEDMIERIEKALSTGTPTKEKTPELFKPASPKAEGLFEKKPEEKGLFEKEKEKPTKE